MSKGDPASKVRLQFAGVCYVSTKHAFAIVSCKIVGTRKVFRAHIYMFSHKSKIHVFPIAKRDSTQTFGVGCRFRSARLAQMQSLFSGIPFLNPVFKTAEKMHLAKEAEDAVKLKEKQKRASDAEEERRLRAKAQKQQQQDAEFAANEKKQTDDFTRMLLNNNPLITHEPGKKGKQNSDTYIVTWGKIRQPFKTESLARHYITQMRRRIGDTRIDSMDQRKWDAKFSCAPNTKNAKAPNNERKHDKHFSERKDDKLAKIAEFERDGESALWRQKQSKIDAAAKFEPVVVPTKDGSLQVQRVPKKGKRVGVGVSKAFAVYDGMLDTDDDGPKPQVAPTNQKSNKTTKIAV